MFSHNCGGKIVEGARFCTGCGSAVEGTGMQNTHQQQSQNTYQPPNQTVYQQPNQNVQMNSITASCQGCFLNKHGKCNYYDCFVNEAEKYACEMRGVPELQKKQRNGDTIKVIAVAGISCFVFVILIGPILGIPLSFIVDVIYHFIGKNIKKKRRENIQRLS